MSNFGGWAIQESCFNFIREILPEGKTILELGSGHGTDALSKHFNMISIENQPEWVGKFNSKYLYVPIKQYSQDYMYPDLPGENSTYQKGWFNYNILQRELESIKYNLILIDGPNGAIGRGGFLKHLDLFNTDVPMIFDDINRKSEYELMVKVSQKLNKPYKQLDKNTGYIL